MAGSVTDIGTTFGLPNYHGELFALTPADTPLLSAIGGLTGGGQTDTTVFEWQTYDLRDPAQATALEGADAPTSQERVRGNVTNVCQIHHEAVGVSYTKQSAMGQFASPSSAPFVEPGSGSNPVTNELDWQVEQALKEIALDVNWSFINGSLNNPTTNASARKTAGLISVCTSNSTDKATPVTGLSSATDTITETATTLANGDKIVFRSTGDMTGVVAGRVYYVVSKNTNSFKVAKTPGGTAITLGTSTSNVSYVKPGSTDLDVDTINEFVQGIYDNGGLTGGEATFLVNSRQKRYMTAAFATAYSEAFPLGQTRNVGGVAVDTVLTDFGTFNIIIDRQVPQDTIIACTLSQLRPVFLNVPGKGVFFEEPLAKTGASDQVQIYGEIGLEYGNEAAHGVLRGLKL